MEKTKEIIFGMVENMQLKRKKAVDKKTKAVYPKLQNDINKVKKDLDKLLLRIWHADYKNDYHSLSLEEAKSILTELQGEIDTILKENF